MRPFVKRTLGCKWRKPNPKWLVESTSKEVCRWIGQKKWISAILLSSLSSVRVLLISGLGICTTHATDPKVKLHHGSCSNMDLLTQDSHVFIFYLFKSMKLSLLVTGGVLSFQQDFALRTLTCLY